MVDSQEIIERSFYYSLLGVSVKMGLSLDPREYPETRDGGKQFSEDKRLIQENKGLYIEIIGAGNNQEKAMKTGPKIVINPQTYIPGDVGLNRRMWERVENNYIVSEVPFESSDLFIDVHLVSVNANENRLLHNVMFTSLPQRGYLKPYTYNQPPFDGNIFLIYSNSYDASSLDKGIIEKVYTYEVKDTLLLPPREIEEGPGIIQIDVDITNNKEINQHIKVP